MQFRATVINHDENGNTLGLVNLTDIKNDITFLDSSKSGTDANIYTIYKLKDSTSSQSLVGGVVKGTHTTTKNNVYSVYDFEQFIKDVQENVENDDYVTALEKTVTEKHLAFVKSEQ